jgi:hypothetical protein
MPANSRESRAIQQIFVVRTIASLVKLLKGSVVASGWPPRQLIVTAGIVHLQVRGVIRPTHCADDAVAVHTTSRNPRALPVDTPLPGSGAVRPCLSSLHVFASIDKCQHYFVKH